MTAILKELLERLSSSEIGPSIYMSTGELGPKYNSLNTGIRERFALKIYGVIANITTKSAQNLFNEIGDVGDLFEKMDEGSHQQSIDDFFEPFSVISYE